jgi:hypothetical protein
MSPPRRLGVAAIVVVSMLVSHVGTARAQDPYVCLDDLSDDEVRHRLLFIESHIAQHSQYSKLWWWGWLTVIGGAGLGYWTAFALTQEGSDPQEYRAARERLFINAAGATLLTTQLSVFAMTSAHAKRKLRRMPTGTPEERRARLRQATVLLERAAKRQTLGISPMAHVGGPFWAIGTGSYLVSRDHPAFFIASAYVMPFIISEARILSQPRASIDAFREYRSMACYGRAGYAMPPSPARTRVDWDVGMGPGGLAFSLTF